MAKPRRRHTRLHNGWQIDVWNDGTEQAFPVDRGNVGCLYIERVVKDRSRRKRWCVVDRDGDRHSYSVYPPKVAGPFDSFDAAAAAYLVILAGR